MNIHNSSSASNISAYDFENKLKNQKKQGVEKITLAFHYSSLDTRELKSVERFLREHPENRVMIVKITEEK